MSQSPLCSFPTSAAGNKSVRPAYTSPEIGVVRSSPAGKMGQSPHNAFPSTSTATTNPLFAAQLMSPPSIQAMANTIFSQNPFLNPTFNPLAAFASPPDIARVQQWFQQNGCSPYTTSPTPSTTPSLISNLSGLSIFSADSSFTLNSQQLNSKFVSEPLDPKKDTQKFLTCFLEAVKNSDQEVFGQLLKTLKFFATGIAKRKISTEFDQKDFRELIKILIERLTLLNDQRSLNAILDILDILINQKQFELAILERKAPVLPVFVGLLQRIVPLALDGNEQQRHALQCALVVIHRCLALVKDKSGARTEPFFNVILTILRMEGKSTLKFVSLGILRCLIYGAEKWKQFVFDRQVIKLVLNVVDKTANRKMFGQSLRFFNTLLDSRDVRFAEEFVKFAGINVLMEKMASVANCSEEDFMKPLNCLKLVSDASAISTQNLSVAINFSIRGTFPTRESKPIVYMSNISNALTFLRNAIVLNKQARDYLASMDEGRAVQHFADLSRQCMCEMNAGELATDKDKIIRLKRSILDDSLVILTAMCKEMSADGTLSVGQKTVAKIIANNETIMFIYQAILRMDTASVFDLQKTVLLGLNRITKAGALPGVFAPGPHLSETLLNFLFLRFDSTDVGKSNLMKICAEVLLRLVVAVDGQNLAVIVSSMSHGAFRPFELLHSITNGGNLDSDLYLTMLKIIKELCKQSVLKSQWSSVDNVHFLSSNSAISNNNEIVRLCDEVLEMLQMGEDQFQDYSFCDIFRLNE
uniref:Uncharacterized protein n=1 Tax=Globodera rostochiensis TaxID=31243 RepID=A0A914HBQ0_GLORO